MSKSHIQYIIILLFIILLNGKYNCVFAQQNKTTYDSIKLEKRNYIIKFEIDSTSLNPNYDTNNIAFSEINSYIKENIKAFREEKLKISITGYIIPFENTDIKKTYSRSFSIKKYLSNKYSITDDFFIIKNEEITWDNEEVIATVSFLETTKDIKIKSKQTIHKTSSSRSKTSKKLFGISTNTLYWAALLPNAEIELYIKDNLSLNLAGQTTWFSFGGGKNLYMIQSISPEFRYWFSKKKPFFGQRIGLYAQISKYDVKIKTNETGNQGDVWGVGATWGYSKPLSIKNNIDNWLLEFTIGVGYSQFHNTEYTTQCVHGFYDRGDTKNINYYGITKAKISITYRFGNKTISKRKGDNR